MASYEIGQLNFKSCNEDENKVEIERYMSYANEKLLSNLKPSRSSITAYSGGTKEEDSITFENECLKASSEAFENGTIYYIHLYIKRLTTPQEFDISLTDDSGKKTQYIKRINVAACSSQYIHNSVQAPSSGSAQGEALKSIQGLIDKYNENYLGNEIYKLITDYKFSNISINEWQSVEFIFTPKDSDLNTLLFTLTRGDTDFLDVPRYPVFIYEELSVVNNGAIGDGTSWKKIGVQSHPGLAMVINGEEILIGNSGIYELKNSLVAVDKFSVIAAAVERDGGKELAVLQKDLADKAAERQNMPAEAQRGESLSESRLTIAKIRTLDSFCVDYLSERKGS